MAGLSATIRRHEYLVALAAITIAICLVFWEVVFAGKSMLPPVWGVMGFAPPWGYPGELPVDDYHIDMGASAWQIETSIFKIREAYANFQVPLWNASEGTGAPLLAHPVTAVFNPLKLPVLLSSSPLMWDIYLIGRYILGAFMMFLFARQMGMKLQGSLTASVGYVLSGSFLIYSNEWWLDVYFTVPLMLYAVESVVRGPRATTAVLLAAAVALNLLAGMPEPSFVTILLAGAYGLVRLIASWRDERVLRPTSLRSVALSVGFLAGFLLAAPALVPFGEYVVNSYSPHTPDEMMGLQHFGIDRLMNSFVPYFNGPPTVSGVRGYTGIAMPFLALLGLRYRPARAHVGWFFAAVALISLAKTYGLPGVNDLGRLPLSVLMIYPTYLAPIITFCVAYMAGLGVERISRGERLGWEPAIVTAILVAVIGYLFAHNLDVRGALPKSGGVWLAFGLGVFVAISLVLALRHRLPGEMVAGACFAVVAVELIVLAPAGVYRERYDTFAKPPFVAYLQTQQATEGRTRLFGYDALLFPNDATAYDLEDIRAITSLFPKRYMEYIREFISPLAVSRFEGGQYSINEEGPTLVADNRMFDLMGARYILTRNTPVPGAVEAQTPAGSATPASQFELIYDDEIKIYRNSRALPRTFVVHNVEEVADDVEALARMHRPGFDPARTAVVERDEVSAALRDIVTTADPTASRASIANYTDNEVTLKASMAQAGLVVLTDTHFPGWQAYLDGEKVPTLRTDYLFRGIVVPAGEHEIRFAYAPASFNLGLLAAAVAIVGLGSWWAFQRLRAARSTGV